jgi:trehalose/maltose transport system substrate-binding protein
MPTRPRLYQQPEILALTQRYPPVIAVKEGTAIVRPSAVAGKKYQDVSAAYYTAVHRILKGEIKADAGLRELSQQLAQITGFPETARTMSD